MPRSRDRRSRSAAWSSEKSPHQPAATVQTPKPTSLRVTSVLASLRYLIVLLLGSPSPAAIGEAERVGRAGGSPLLGIDQLVCWSAPNSSALLTPDYCLLSTR